MSRIGSIGILGTDQLRALTRLQELGQAISQNQLRLSTLKRINSAKDDPAGLVQAALLQSELNATQQASRNVTRASAILNTADAAAGEIVSQLQSARSLVLAAASGTLSSSEVAANQAQVDQILNAVDNLSHTEFDGKRLLDGSSGYSTSGVDSTQIRNVDVQNKTSSGDATVNVDVTQQATQRTDQYSGGSLSSDTTLVVQGPDGTTTVQLANGADTQAIADAFNSVSYLTGITANRVDANNVDFTTVDYGSAASISIDATAGSFSTSTTQAGTDAVATVNGEQYTGDGATFNVNSSELSLVLKLDPGASGALTPFTISGSGLQFNVGSSAASTAAIGLPDLQSARLGGAIAPLSSIRSGGDNTLTGGHAATALKILDDAIGDATRAQARIGGFENFTLGSASRVLGAQQEQLSSALSSVQDTNVAVESALLTQNQLLQSTTLQALSISNLQNQNVLDLLKSAAQT